MNLLEIFILRYICSTHNNLTSQQLTMQKAMNTFKSSNTYSVS